MSTKLGGAQLICDKAGKGV